MKKTRNKSSVILCRKCGKEKRVYAYLKAKGYAKYCSRACYLSDRWQKSPKCKNCGKKTDTRFCNPECQRDYWNKKSRPDKQSYYWRKKMSIVQSLGGCCSECGVDDIRVLDIDHIDPSLKTAVKDWSWSRRIKDWEANEGNLRILCANCHRVHTWIQRGFGVGLDDESCE